MIAIDASNGIAFVRLAGSIGSQELRNQTKGLTENVEHTPGMDGIWDFREAEITGATAPAILARVQFISEQRTQLARRVGLVVGDKLHYGLLRMWESYSEMETHQENRIFQDVVSARGWLLAVGCGI